MTDIAEIGIRADITELQNAVRELNRLADQGQRTETRVSRSMGGIGAAFAAVAGALGAGNIAGKLIETERETGILTSSLKTVTGSAKGAQEAFEAIQVLASQLPESVNDVTTAFTKMANLGLDPSEAAIRSYSNTAAAMGKNLMDMIEAVADASTFEFERLKEFGIKAKQQGDNVSFTFQGVTTTVKKSSDEITGYLKNIGDVNFAGASADRMKTLDGAISNLGDTWDGLFRTINSAGAGELIASGVRGATEAIKDLNDFISSGQMAGYIDAIGGRFSFVFDIAIAGFNAIKDAALGLYGIWYMAHNEAMMAMGATTDDFFREIKDGFTSAPENIKAFIQILTVEFAALFDKVIAGSKLFYDILTNPLDASATFDAYRKEIELIDGARSDSIQGIFDEKLAVELSYESQIKKANDLRAAFEAKNAEAKKEVLGQYKKGGAADTTATEAQLKAAKELLKTEERRAERIKDMLSDMTRETDLMGELSKEVQTRYDIEHGLIEVLGGINGLEAQSLLNAARLNDEKRTQIELDKQLEDKLADDIMRNSQDAIDAVAEWGEKSKKEAEEISSALTDALMRGFESGKGFAENMKDTVKNMFSSLVLKPVIQPLMDKASGAIQGAFGGLSSGANMALAGAAIVGSLWNDYMEKGFQELTSEFRQGRQNTGTILGDANAKSDSINKSIGMLSDIAGDTLNVNYAMLSALNDIKSGSGKASGLIARSNINSPDISGMGTSFGGVAIVGKIIGGELGSFVDGVLGGVSKAIRSKSKNVIDTGIQFVGSTLADVLATGSLDALSYAAVQTKKKVFGVTTSNKVNTTTEALDDEITNQFALVFESAGGALQEASKAFGIDFAKYAPMLMIEPAKLSLKDLDGEELTAEIEKFFSSTLDSWAEVIGGEGLSFQKVGEGAFETVVRLATELNTFNSYADTLGLSFNLTGFAAVTASQNIIDFAGGIDSLTGSLSGYYKNFFTESERSGKQLESLTARFKELGYDAAPKTREEFRGIIETLVNETGLLTEESQKQFASLINLQGAFSELVPLTEEMAKSSKSAAAVASERLGLEERFLQAQGNTSELRNRERESLDESNRSILNQIFALEDLKKAQEEAAKAQEKWREEDSARIAKHYNDQTSLQKTYFELTHSQEEILAAQRAEQLAAVDSGNKAILSQIFAQQDLAKAQEAAAKIAEEAAKIAEEAADVIASAMKAANDERISLEQEYFNLIATEQQKRQAQLASLLSDEAREVQNKIYGYKDAQAAAESAKKAGEDAARAAQDAANEQTRAAQQAADEQARLIKGTQDALTSAIRKLRGESEQLNDLDRQRAKNTLNAALAAAQSGKSIVGFAGLEDAINAVSNIDKSTFTSAEDYQRELARTLSILDRLSGYAGMPASPTNPIIGNGALAMQTQTNQQMAQNMAAVEDRMTDLTIKIEDNTKRTKMMLERWEAIGMPVSRTA